jgi:hypothetical protein
MIPFELIIEGLKRKQMNTCKSCKYWNGGDKSTGECDKADITGYERNPKPKTDPTIFEIYADASDDTGMIVYLTTGCNFGCIHHSPKK